MVMELRQPSPNAPTSDLVGLGVTILLAIMAIWLLSLLSLALTLPREFVSPNQTDDVSPKELA